MKILHLITGLTRGGAETMLCKVLDAADRQANEHVVLSLTAGGILEERIRDLGVPVYDLGMAPSRVKLTDLRALYQRVADVRPDIIQGWMYHGNFAASAAALMLALRGYRRPKVVWNVRHGLNSAKGMKSLTNALVKLGALVSASADVILFNSRVSAEQHGRIGYKRDRIQVIPNGFDSSVFKPDNDDYRHMRVELGLPASARLVGIAGRFDPLKDFETFLAAAARLTSMDGVYFVLAGPGVDGGNATLQELARSQGLQARTFFLGDRGDMPRFFAALDVYVSSSISEGFSNCIGEALACGVPCVVTDVGDSSWIVGDSGEVVAPRSPQQIADAVFRLLSMEPAALAALGEGARKQVSERFSLTAVVGQYEDLYGSFRR